jgi:hypothetical protein
MQGERSRRIADTSLRAIGARLYTSRKHWATITHMEIRKFFVAIGSDWFTRMSEPLAVPFTIAALFVPATSYRILFATLAVIAASVTCFRIWEKEHIRAEKLNAEMSSLLAGPSFNGHFYQFQIFPQTGLVPPK